MELSENYLVFPRAARGWHVVRARYAPAAHRSPPPRAAAGRPRRRVRPHLPPVQGEDAKERGRERSVHMAAPGRRAAALLRVRDEALGGRRAAGSALLRSPPHARDAAPEGARGSRDRAEGPGPLKALTFRTPSLPIGPGPQLPSTAATVTVEGSRSVRTTGAPRLTTTRAHSADRAPDAPEPTLVDLERLRAGAGSANRCHDPEPRFGTKGSQVHHDGLFGRRGTRAGGEVDRLPSRHAGSMWDDILPGATDAVQRLRFGT